jgi:hypothetical protein
MSTISPNARHRSLEEVRSEDLAPHERLMLAVLEEAILTFQAGLVSSCPQRRRRGHEAGEWFRNRDFDSLFAFENVCSVLGLDASYVRTGVRRLRRDALQSQVPVPRPRIRRANPGMDSMLSGLGAGAA